MSRFQPSFQMFFFLRDFISGGTKWSLIQSNFPIWLRYWHQDHCLSSLQNCFFSWIAKSLHSSALTLKWISLSRPTKEPPFQIKKCNTEWMHSNWSSFVLYPITHTICPLLAAMIYLYNRWQHDPTIWVARHCLSNTNSEKRKKKLVAQGHFASLLQNPEQTPVTEVCHCMMLHCIFLLSEVLWRCIGLCNQPEAFLIECDSKWWEETDRLIQCIKTCKVYKLCA